MIGVAKVLFLWLAISVFSLAVFGLALVIVRGVARVWTLARLCVEQRRYRRRRARNADVTATPAIVRPPRPRVDHAQRSSIWLRLEEEDSCELERCEKCQSAFAEKLIESVAEAARRTP